jgi:hypothetical protein
LGDGVNLVLTPDVDLVAWKEKAGKMRHDRAASLARLLHILNPTSHSYLTEKPRPSPSRHFFRE